MIRTALLNGNNINRDSDFSKYIESISGPGVIEGLEVSASSVAEGYAWISCERSNGETVYPVVYITSPVEISGEGEVYIEVKQSAIDDGELNNEDGTGIAEVKIGTTPSTNAIKLATITGGVVEDNRVFIPKLDNINILFASVEDLDERVEALEEQGAVDHLEESGLVGELYTLSDTLFKQNTPTLADSTLDCNVSDVAANTEIHIQRIGSGVASNQLKLKVKMVGSSTQNLKVEVRTGTQVTVTANKEAYWYGNTVIASGSIPYSQISSSYAEKTITLDNQFGGTKGQLLDIVLYMDTVNTTNYYCVACDSTQYSEAFSYVSVNGSTRTRSKLMPYCISDGFVQSLLCKANSLYEIFNTSYTKTISAGGSTTYGPYTITTAGETVITFSLGYTVDSNYWFDIKYNGTNVKTFVRGDYSFTKSCEVGDTISVVGYNNTGAGASFTVYLTGQTTNQITISGKSSEIKSIGEIGFITIFGAINDDFFVGITSNTATTGSITPGNFVGYIKIGKYKIPYYNE